MEEYFEVNCSGIVGPTHNYGGLALGNLASQRSSLQLSYPKEAAVQNLNKMKLLMDMGVIQIVFPPANRPLLSALKSFGLSGNTDTLIENASLSQLEQVYSASSMWTANAATVSPSPDTKDQKLHITPANLFSNFHRSIEADFTYTLLKRIFKSESIVIHKPLEANDLLADEGAANHMRLTTSHDKEGLEIFVYNYDSDTATDKRVGRQSKSASEAVINRHQIKNALPVQQNPEAIKEGIFHNDVIAINHCNILIVHEKAYVDQSRFISEIKTNFKGDLVIREVKETELSLNSAIDSYFFNSQIVQNKARELTLFLPTECNGDPNVVELISKLKNEIPSLKTIKFINVRESMRNGGGPACLRLNIVLSKSQLNDIHKGVILTDELYEKLCKSINTHYRDQLAPDDLKNPHLVRESKKALLSLSKILDLEYLYEF